MYLTDLCLIFPASIFTVQRRGLCHPRALRTSGRPGTAREKERRGKEKRTGEGNIQAVGWRRGARRERDVRRARTSQYYGRSCGGSRVRFAQDSAMYWGGHRSAHLVSITRSACLLHLSSQSVKTNSRVRNFAELHAHVLEGKRPSTITCSSEILWKGCC